jgi:putative FmdB family regulatory protein
MPIYEYQCSNCGHLFDELQKMSEPPLIKCPACGHNTLKRLIGSGAGIIFKGSGFYLTDYKKKADHKASPVPSKTKKEKPAAHKTPESAKKEPKKESNKDTKQPEN